MLDRKRVSQPKPPRRRTAGLVFLLTWCLTLMVGGAIGVVSQGLYRVYRDENSCGSNGLAAAPYRPQAQAGARLEKRAAIIIDDLGPDLAQARRFCDLEMPLTMAILPYQRYSRQIVHEAVRRGKEAILHVPMQPRDYPAVNPGTGSLLLGMDRERIQSEVAQQLDALPGCVGVSNHMGSLFTEQALPMRWVLAVVAERHLFFIDSLTTPNSTARDVAADLSVPFAVRTHFLDGVKSEDAIVRQLCRVVDSAVRAGGAIGIAHPSDETLAALPKVVKAFAEKGVRLVPVSEMVSSYPASNIKAAHKGTDPRAPAPDPS